MEYEKLNNNKFIWTTFYMEFADKLLQFKNNRNELLTILEEVYFNLDINNPFTEKGELIDDICPFTVIGSFNKQITKENRIAIATEISKRIGVSSSIPSEFEGIPLLNNMRSWFFGFKNRRKPNDIDNLWTVFELGIKFADNQIEDNKKQFIHAYEAVRQQYGIKWNLSMGLYWIRPLVFLNLDEKNREYILSKNNNYSDVAKISNLKQTPDANKYLKILDYFKMKFNEEKSSHHNFPELSYDAWNFSDVINSKKYWIYSPGQTAFKWDEFYTQGIMAINWGGMGDLKEYSSKDDMKIKMKKIYDQDDTYLHQAHATWQFANEILPGDIVYVKKGKSIIIGYGIVESEYIYDEKLKSYNHIHKVNWKANGEWDNPRKENNKTLTEITSNINEIDKLKKLFIHDPTGSVPISLDNLESYTEEDFLNEVFMDQNSYRRLVKILKLKKNLIIQGPPGVGKTFSAKRLAYSMMEEKDEKRVQMVQFHQSYSYEDFIMGYRPTESGFKLATGPFYEFCKIAEKDSEQDYFFIIDEINRGNLSQIFGELLMLIENDKRGQELRLIYKDELFSVPENVHIIGMMNTADRSLAIIDYALRRRFAFYNLEPAFDSRGFTEIIKDRNNSKFKALVEQLKKLNKEISEDVTLGSGFQIGHSYLCSDEIATDEWLTVIIDYELLPLLEEYWFDEPDKLKQWKNNLLGVLND